jgi:hypothetical protein
MTAAYLQPFQYSDPRLDEDEDERSDRLDPIYFEGEAAFDDGEDEDSNPYPPGTDEHDEWNDGYNGR